MGMMHLMFFVTLFIFSALFALAEIQIEGPHGWAASLPTWRVSNRWTHLFYSAKPLTGYHLYTQLFAVVAVHLPFGLSLTPFTWRMEARQLSFLILFWVLEDFLWFLLNPAFGLKRFRREHVWWHAKTWWWIMPRDYWVFIPVGLALYRFSCP